MAKKGFVKNTVTGKQKGRAYPEAMKTLCLTELLVRDIHEVARRHRIPESTLRNWVRAARKKDKDKEKSDWEKERAAAIKKLSEQAANGAGLAMEAALDRLEKDPGTKLRAEQLKAVLLDPEKTEDEKIDARIELGMLEPLSDFAINRYIGTMTRAAATVQEMASEDGPRQVRVVLGEAEKYAK